MLSSENIARKFRWELFAIVESNSDGGIVGLQEHVRCNDLILEFRVFTREAWILVAAHVPPRPTVKAAALHMSNVVGNEIVTQSIAFVHRHPEILRPWIERHK